MVEIPPCHHLSPSTDFDLFGCPDRQRVMHTVTAFAGVGSECEVRRLSFRRISGNGLEWISHSGDNKFRSGTVQQSDNWTGGVSVGEIRAEFKNVHGQRDIEVIRATLNDASS